MKIKSKENNLIIWVCFLILFLGVIFSWPKWQVRSASEPHVEGETKTPLIIPLPKTSIPPKSWPHKSLRVPILMYHHVGYLSQEHLGIKYDQTAVDLTVSPEDFETQVKYFKSLGFHTVTMQQVYDYMESDLGLPSKPIILTFDDGYKDVFTYAVPVLKNYNYIGSFAIATNLLGRPSYAVWDDIIAASASGMEIVSHTENHLDLSNPVYSDADLHREIFDSKQLLEEKLGYNIDFFVYPYGRYNQKVLQMTQEAGYKMALTTIYGVTVRQESLLATPRVRVHGQDGLMKLKKIFLPAPQSAAALLSP